MSEQRLSQQQVDILVGAALAAPSMHNTQPWRFAVDETAIDISLDRSRALPAEDPTGRALLIATGAAIFNLRCAAASLGLDSWYGLTPTPAEPDLIARVVLSPSPAPDRDLAGLYRQISRRHTSREPGRPTVLSMDTRILLVRAGLTEGAELTWFDPPGTRDVLRSGAAALLRGWADHERTAERARWISAERADDGIPLAALGPRPAVFPAPVRDLGAGLPGRGRDRKAFESEPVLAVLSTAGDGPLDQVTAGTALQRILLEATKRGLHTSFLNQALEYDDSRAEVQRIAGRPGVAQMVIRFSHSSVTVTTPRRSVADVVQASPQ
jgi:hypothetical protein